MTTTLVSNVPFIPSKQPAGSAGLAGIKSTHLPSSSLSDPVHDEAPGTSTATDMTLVDSPLIAQSEASSVTPTGSTLTTPKLSQQPSSSLQPAFELEAHKILNETSPLRNETNDLPSTLTLEPQLNQHSNFVESTSSTLGHSNSANELKDLFNRQADHVPRQPFDYLAAIDRLDLSDEEDEPVNVQRKDVADTHSLSNQSIDARQKTDSISIPSTPPRHQTLSSTNISPKSNINRSPSSTSSKLQHLLSLSGIESSPTTSLRNKMKTSLKRTKPQSPSSNLETGRDDNDDDDVCNLDDEREGAGGIEYTRSPRAHSILSGKANSTLATGATTRMDKMPFDRFALPTKQQIELAEKCLLIGESGQQVEFGELVRERGRVVVVFLRHFWCGLCAQYVKALRTASRNLVSAASGTSISTGQSPTPAVPPLYILLITSGSPNLIPIYRSRLDCPFPIYVDRKRTLYKTLGMNLKTWNPGKDKDKGSYVQISMGQNVAESFKSAVAMRAYPGSQKQLGGEFVFSTNEAESDDIVCSFASRMNTTRSHAEVRELFAAAGVHLSEDDALSVFGTTDGSNVS
ncbi:hypothetical protein OIO90_003839 [Microbotryomycetes sp. JL221]|nr:hypothetical protein OIO90_003839 [Microbotryomycetes sp. JL221]